MPSAGPLKSQVVVASLGAMISRGVLKIQLRPVLAWASRAENGHSVINRGHAAMVLLGTTHGRNVAFMYLFACIAFCMCAWWRARSTSTECKHARDR